MGSTRRASRRRVRPVTAALIAIAMLAAGCAAEPSISEQQAAKIVDEVLGTFGAGLDVAPSDFAPVVDLLGEDGVWVDTGGVERDGSMVAEYLASFTDIESIERISDGVVYDDGWGFMTLETSSGGSEYSLGFVISRDDDDALRISEIRSSEFEALFEEEAG